MTNVKTIRAENLGQVDPNKGIIVDVRTAMEHAEKHIAFGHAHVPLDELKPADFMMRHGLDHAAEVYILCRSGKRAAQAAEKFIADGYPNVWVVEGGLVACEDCGHEVKGYGAKGAADKTAKTTSPISLERQVRITAGAFIVVGAALSLLVSPAFALVPLFVGSGLVFAGVTDRCGLALVLTKAPWNKMDAGTSCCPATGGAESEIGCR